MQGSKFQLSLQALKDSQTAQLNDLYFGDENCVSLSQFISENKNLQNLEIKGK